MTTQDTDSRIANEIFAQLGSQALMMLGARGRCVPTARGLVVSIRGSRKCNTITITLDPDDTYSVRFHRFTPAKVNTRTGAVHEAKDKTVSEFSGVYADGLHRLIESETGLCTSL